MKFLQLIAIYSLLTIMARVVMISTAQAFNNGYIVPDITFYIILFIVNFQLFLIVRKFIYEPAPITEKDENE